MKKYIIPVELMSRYELAVLANSEAEAINKVNETMHNNKGIAATFNSYKIIDEYIECEDDDLIIDELVNDGLLEPDSYLTDNDKEVEVLVSTLDK